MSLDQLHAILAAGAENPPPVADGPQALRAWFAAGFTPTPVAEGTVAEPVDLGPCGGEIVRVPGSDPGRRIVYFHGGGFIFGSPATHRVIASHLARASGAEVISVAYRLAPEFPAPAAHEDALAVWRRVVADGDPSRLVLAGDSAGGNLALSVAVKAQAQGLPLPVALVLMSPALDFAGDGESHRLLADAPLVNRPFSELFLSLYLGAGDRRDPAVTPFYGPLPALPPTLIHVGGWEMLLDDSRTIARRLTEAGTEVELKVWEGMCHSWQLFAPFLDEGMASLNEAGRFAAARMR